MDAITVAVTIIVCAVPEGLPMLTSILLSFQSMRMAKDNVLVHKINGLETAGSLSILFSDKTGTITEGRLSVVEMATGNVTVFNALSKMPSNLALDVITGIGVNNSAVASDGAIIGGNSTDRALMSFLMSSNAVNSMTKEDVRAFNAFDSNRKMSSVTITRDGNMLDEILRNGPQKGVYTIAWHDDLTLFNQKFPNMIDSFKKRIAFNLSDEEALNFADVVKDPSINKNNAVYFEAGRGKQKFRPYSTPNTEWFNEIMDKISCEDVF